MVPFGIEPGASSHPVSGPAAERPYVRRHLLPDSIVHLDPFTLEPHQYRLVLLRENRKRYRWIMWVAVVLLVPPLILIAWDVSSTGSFRHVRIWFPVFVFAGVWFWLMLYQMPKSLALNPLNRFQYGTYEVKIEGDSLVVTTDSGRRASIPLHQIVKVSKLPDWYLLYESSITALLVPRAAFQNPSSEVEFFRRLDASRDPGSV
jgi:hypothetical protein